MWIALLLKKSLQLEKVLIGEIVKTIFQKLLVFLYFPESLKVEVEPEPLAIRPPDVEPSPL